MLNPIPAGVLENQATLGGGQFDPPPSKSPVLSMYSLPFNLYDKRGDEEAKNRRQTLF